MDVFPLLLLPHELRHRHRRRHQDRPRGGDSRQLERGYGAVRPHGRARPEGHPDALPSQAHQPCSEACRRARRGQMGGDPLRAGDGRDRRQAAGAYRQVRPRDVGLFRGHVPLRPPVGAHPLLQQPRQPGQRHRSRHHLLVLELHAEHGHGGLAYRGHLAGGHRPVRYVRGVGPFGFTRNTARKAPCGASTWLRWTAPARSRR